MRWMIRRLPHTCEYSLLQLTELLMICFPHQLTGLQNDILSLTELPLESGEPSQRQHGPP
jgi:hypothetical protein